MSEYRCHKCETFHTTENMVSICAACFYALRSKLAEVEKKYADLKAEIPGIIGSVQFGTATRKSGVAASATPIQFRDELIRLVEESR